MTVLTDKEIVRCYLDGQSQQLIARTDGRAQATVRYVLLRNGVSLRDARQEWVRNGKLTGQRNVESGRLPVALERAYAVLAEHPEIRQEVGRNAIVKIRQLPQTKAGQRRVALNNIASGIGAATRFQKGHLPLDGSGNGKNSRSKKGHRVRSSWECKFADWLFDSGIPYEYEPKLFDLGDGLTYRPDFYLPQADSWVEIKGYETARNRLQHERFRATGHSLLVVGPDLYALFLATQLTGRSAE